MGSIYFDKKRKYIIGIICLIIFTLFITNCSDNNTNNNIYNPNIKTFITKSINVDNIRFNMVYVEGGTYIMGDNSSDNTKPEHLTQLSDFWMCETEITQELWLKVMGKNPSTHNGLTDGVDYGINLQRPVESINFYELLVFCNKLSEKVGLEPVYTIKGTTNTDRWGTIPYYGQDSTWEAVKMNMSKNGFRIPIEAEWEYAARGGKNKDNYIYSGSNNIDNVAWYEYTSEDGVPEKEKKTHPTKTKAPNSLGIFDMTGNVSEWCFDFWNENYDNFPTEKDPFVNKHQGGKLYNRILRGGNFSLSEKNCTVFFRSKTTTNITISSTGARLVAHLPK